MMPRPDNRLLFDARPAIAQLDTESTSYLRELHPGLSWAWDKLDELRDLRDDESELNAAEQLAEKWMGIAEEAAADLDRLVAEEDMSETVQTVLERLADILDGRT